jgi:tetraacyldisaccharide 4'-kinase
VTWFRNKLYDSGLKSSRSYSLPIICVGNLSVGGTGKTPMIEYLIRLLKDEYKIATLSRGYKRKTNGFVIADETMNTHNIGDEPFQFFKKFKEIIVSVDANRQNGIEHLLKLSQKPKVILLDDAFQHRKVKAGFNILLTSYENMYISDIVLPTGNLREPKSGAKRAEVIIVTKCPNSISDTEKNKIISSLKPLQNQHVFFSSIVYSNTIKNDVEEMPLVKFKGKKITLVTGIANAKPLVEYLNSEGLTFDHLNFKDHHDFSENDLNLFKSKELIITTEKDFVRLQPYLKDNTNVFYIPIETSIDKASEFNGLIKKFIANF